MSNYLVQKTKNKILQIINTIPYVRYQSELNYQAEVEKYIPHLVTIPKNDLEIVEKIKQEGVFITSLADLGIASTPKFIQAAQNLLPQIPNSTSEDNQEFVIHASSQQIMAYPIVFLWGLEQRLINIIENFLGLPVAYHGVYFRRDIANKLEKGTRLWHLDKEARKILKIIVYLHDIDENQGLFQYIHPALSSEISKSLRYKSGYLHDQIMQRVTLEGATKELKRLLDKHYSPHTLPIKWHLIANRCHHFQDQFLTLIHRNYPTRTVQTYPKSTMSSSSSFIFTHPTNIRLLFLRLSFLTW